MSRTWLFLAAVGCSPQSGETALQPVPAGVRLAGGLQIGFTASGRDQLEPAPAHDSWCEHGCERVVSTHDGVQVEWTGTMENATVLWRIAERAPGVGPLRLELDLDGAAVSWLGRDTAWLHGPSGHWSVSGLAAWDAKGNDLHLQLDRSADGLAVLVIDDDATYPIVVDPTFTTQAAIWRGEANEQGLGSPVLADVNGDGFDDLVAGAPGDSRYALEGGALVVHHGSASGIAPVADVVIRHTPAEYELGRLVRAVGDVNGDGYEDILATAPGFSPPVIYVDFFDDRGRIYVYYGGPNGLSAANSWSWSGTTNERAMGRSAWGGRDLNGDGYDDFVVTHSDDDDARAHLFLGGPSGPSRLTTLPLTAGIAMCDIDGNGTNELLLGRIDASSWTGNVSVYQVSSTAATFLHAVPGPSSNARYGKAIRCLGDLNGDGDEEIAVAGPGDDLIGVHFGTPAGLVATADQTLAENGIGGSYFGFADNLAVSDLDGDGLLDLAVDFDGGTSKIYRGTPTGLSTVGQGVSLGSLMAGGDVNGDGVGDLVSGSYPSLTGAGYAYVHHGVAGTGIGTDRDATVYGEDRADGLGLAMTGADVDGDGFDELFLAAPGFEVDLLEAGQVRMYAGGSPLATAVPTMLDSGGGNFGEAIANLGDVNGDGFEDIAVAAPNVRVADAVVGEVRVWLGSATGLTGPADQIFTGVVDAELIAGMTGGDLDGDGLDDLVLCVRSADYSGPGHWRVHRGTSSGLEAVATYTGDGCKTSYEQDVALKTGDFNGDGVDDLAVETNLSVTIFHGSSTGLTQAARFTGGDDYGESLAVGDLDGDGFDDLVVGAPRAGAGTARGRVTVHHGGPTGLETTPRRTYETTQNLDYLGRSVTLTDLNNDGFADLAIGRANSLYDQGVMIVHGGPFGLGAYPVETMVFTHLGEEEGFGRVVEAVGDLDGDGFGDLAVMAGHPYSDTHGVVRVYRGRAGNDNDGDGVDLLDDCDDTDPAQDAGIFAVDADGDGFGDPNDFIKDCGNAGVGVDNTDDCNDADPAVNPDATDVCGDDLDTNCDGIGLPGTDEDGDGLTDLEEAALSTDRCIDDTDGDGLNDGDEATHGTLPLTADTDGDGLLDGQEVTLGSSPLTTDTDGDGLDDGDEVNTHGTSPSLVDTDDDGLTDPDELNLHGTSPVAADTDGDGLTDGDEVNVHGTDPLNGDTDGDQLFDSAELDFNSNPLVPDTDGDGLSDWDESVHGTNPNSADTDGDTLSDFDEVNVLGTSPGLADVDGDGLDDAEELALSTDPWVADTDLDLLLDGDEVNLHGSSPLDADTDGDGLNDGDEVNLHGTSPVLADTDADGITDPVELANGTDPLDASDPPPTPTPTEPPPTEPPPTQPVPTDPTSSTPPPLGGETACGCSNSPGAPLLPGLGLLVFMVGRRRR